MGKCLLIHVRGHTCRQAPLQEYSRVLAAVTLIKQVKSSHAVPQRCCLLLCCRARPALRQQARNHVLS